MSCEYCGYFGHNKDECPQAEKDRRLNHTMGCGMLVILFPFAVIGFAIGAVFSALRGGFQAALGLWGETWKLIGKKPDRPESA